MIKHEDGSITDLPVVRPATSNPKSFDDTLLKCKEMRPHEVDVLCKSIDNYLPKEDDEHE
jgi:hypothetical protein